MVFSMTGFGRAVKKAAFGTVVVEVQSVNRKYLEVSVSLPREYSRFEMEVRKCAAEQVVRGQVSIRIQVLSEEEGRAVAEMSRLKALKKGWEEAALELGYPKESITLSFLVEHAQLKSEVVEESRWTPIGECLDEALAALSSMRKKEGEAMARDMKSRLALLKSLISQIEGHAPEFVSKMRKKLKERIESVCQPGPDWDERLMREIALLSEKVDITEEVTRFYSHLSQFDQLFSAKSTGLGRKMDFLIQEMGREVNTIGSKSLDAQISSFVVEMKSEMEKIREQIQNIE